MVRDYLRQTMRPPERFRGVDRVTCSHKMSLDAATINNTFEVLVGPLAPWAGAPGRVACKLRSTPGGMLGAWEPGPFLGRVSFQR